MKLSPIMERISAGAIGFKAVEGVEAIIDLETWPTPLPACFIVQAEESITPEQEGAGLISLLVTTTFDVVVMVSAAVQRGRNRDELSDYADAVTAQLLGWTPDAAVYRPFIPVGGRLLGIGGGRASWITRFRTVSRLRKQG